MTPVMPKQDNATANVTSKETNVTLVPLTIMVFLTVTVSFHAYYSRVPNKHSPLNKHSPWKN